MDAAALDTISQLIGSMGFPIAMCIYLTTFLNKTMKDVTEAMNRMTQAFEIHNAKCEGMTEHHDA